MNAVTQIVVDGSSGGGGSVEVVAASHIMSSVGVRPAVACRNGMARWLTRTCDSPHVTCHSASARTCHQRLWRKR